MLYQKLAGRKYQENSLYLHSLPIRKKKLTLSVIIILNMAFFMVSNLYGNDNDGQYRFTIQLEAGPVWQGRNDVQIPNNENGTRFSLVDLVGPKTEPYRSDII